MNDTRQMDLLDDGTPRAAARSDLAKLARRLPASVHLGTSSWSFPGWAGLVYDRGADRGVLARHGLAAYAEHPLLTLAGVDRSYYGGLPVSTWHGYAEQVPADFRFITKVPWTATDPTDRGTGGANPHFLEPGAVAEAIADMQAGLGDKLAAVVCQFPPVRGIEAEAFAARLHRFLLGLPAGVTVATEVRTPAWLGPAYASALTDVGAVHCYTVHPRMPAPGIQAHRLATPPPGPYVARWNLGHGRHYAAARARYAPFDRLVDEDPDTRTDLAEAVCASLDRGEPAYIAVNNKAEGCAPLSVEALAAAIVDRRGA